MFGGVRSSGYRSLCVGRFLHSAQRTVNQRIKSLVYHRSRRRAIYYSAEKPIVGGWLKHIFQRIGVSEESVLLKRENDPPLLLGIEWLIATSFSAPLMPVWILQALEAMRWLLQGTQADRGRLRAANGMENFLEGGKIQAADFQGEMFLC